MEPRIVYLTGATGFIGNRLARRLAARGDRLRCLVRNPERAGPLKELGAELIVGQVSDPYAHARGMQGCSLAYHLAAIYDVGVVNAAELEHTNVGGTTAFIEALESTSLPRAVYVSTTVALGPAENDISDNVIEYDGPYPTEYHRTKAQAHRIARAAQERGVPLVIACPAFVYGPGDNGPGGRFVDDLVHGRAPGLLTDPAWFSFVYVDDVAAGLERLADQGNIGSTYVFSGEPASMNDFAKRTVKLAGRRMPLLRFPPAMAAATGTVLDSITRLTGIRFPITRETVRSTAHDRWLHSHEPATRELGWRPRLLDEGLPETVRWFQERQG
jgi:nucleoside-diphosphate-sugar epimerase